MAIRQLILLLILAAAASIMVNAVSPNGISLIGQYRDLSSGDGPIVPPEAAEGDPPFIDVNVAQFEHAAAEALFIDSREPEEFDCGTIPGSINIPFDFLPDGDLGRYFDSILVDYGHDHPMIVFCSGEECDLSLHLARNLQAFGYSQVSIFFGGSREWEEFGLGIERRVVCSD
jgi:rhodanese-related sulfurtransferase